MRTPAGAGALDHPVAVVGAGTMGRGIAYRYDADGRRVEEPSDLP